MGPLYEIRTHKQKFSSEAPIFLNRRYLSKRTYSTPLLIDTNLSGDILCIVVRELRTLYVCIYILG